jgi:lipopolysaccharide transport system permease protein
MPDTISPPRPALPPLTVVASATIRRHVGLVASVVRNRQLLVQLSIREIESHFRGSLLGKVWAVVVPLFMLGLYTLVFSAILHVKWPGEPRSELRVALLYFAGLILSNFFTECINRAPVLFIGNVSFIKKVVFPLEILAWVAVAGALFRAGISACVLIVYYLIIEGLPPVSAIAIPAIVAPLVLMVAGLTWIFAAIGVFVRDLRHAMMVVMPAMMFLSPIFFPLSAVPEKIRFIFYINPLTYPVEAVRNALFFGMWPNWLAIACYAGAAWFIAWAGLTIFTKLRTGFADVI